MTYADYIKQKYIQKQIELNSAHREAIDLTKTYVMKMCENAIEDGDICFDVDKNVYPLIEHALEELGFPSHTIDSTGWLTTIYLNRL